MGQRTLVWALIALLAAPSLAGCLSDLQRERLDLTWEPSTTVHGGPVAVADGLPAMVLLEGPVTIDPETSVEVTGVQASLQQTNLSMELTLVRLTIGERSLRAGDLGDADPALATGDLVRVTLLPAADQPARVSLDEPVNLSVELQWRFRAGDRFDAGRLEVDRNVTVTAPDDLGLGAAETTEARIGTLVFPAIGREVPESVQGVDVFALKDDGTSRLGPAEVSFRQGEGVALADLDQAVDVPDGYGYLVFKLQEGELEGTAIHRFGEPEQATPGPGAWLTLGMVVATALILARGNRSKRSFR